MKPSFHIALLSLALAAFLPGILQAQAHEGHATSTDKNGDAALILGNIDFPTSGQGEAAREFHTGAMALHSFWYPEAADHFRRARQLDPDFAMAYWGEAMTSDHPLWGQHDGKAGREVLAALDKQARKGTMKWDAREKAYLDAVRVLYDPMLKDDARYQAYAEAMAKVATAFPRDDEAIVFAALARMATPGFKPENPASVVPVAAPLEEVYQRNPQHPGAVHYLIHAYDSSTFAPMGLRLARVYAGIAPASSHALHMPSHIFRELGMWQEMAASNEAAWRASVEWQQRTKRPVVARDFHALDWRLTAYRQQGRFADARKLLDELDAAVAGSRGTKEYAELLSGATARRATYALGARTVGLHPDVALPPDLDIASAPENNDLFFILWAATVSGNDKVRDALTKRARARVADPKTEPYRKHMEAALLDFDAERLRRAGDLAGALAVAGKARDTRRAGEPADSTSGNEGYAELLALNGKHAEALPLYEALNARHPNHSEFLLGAARSAAALGKTDLAKARYVDLLKVWDKADPDLPALQEAKAFLARQ